MRPSRACAESKEHEKYFRSPGLGAEYLPPTTAKNPVYNDLGPLPPVLETMKQLEPASLDVITHDLSREIVQLPRANPDVSFVELFRGCTPYIKMHQGSTMVIHVASEVLESIDVFDEIMEEIAVLALLGVRPVLLVGTRAQVDASLELRANEPVFHGGVRETDESTMRVVQEVCGYMRSRVEGALARGRSRSGPGGSVGSNVVGGNFFYTAQPVGVREGIDYGFTGEVRSFDVQKIKMHLEQGEIVLMSAIGYSASGTSFNVKTEQVAQAAAAALGATKLIYITPHQLVVRSDEEGSSQIASHQHQLIPASEGNGQRERAVLQSMRIADATTLIKHLRSTRGCSTKPGESCDVMLDLCEHCVGALQLGVTRAHLLPPAAGALIQELYTTDGIGTLISRDVYDGIRLATDADVPAILSLIEPLEARGVLVKRPPETLARDVHVGYYYVYTRDDSLLAVAQLKRYADTQAELGCLVVAPQYRRQGCGDAMLGYMERTAVAAGVTNLFVLSTVTMQWFVERGFSEAPVGDLPERRRAIYDEARNSKIYMKSLSASSRELDAEELFWMASIDQGNAKP